MEPGLILPQRMDEVLTFAREAAEHFLRNPGHWTYTRGDVDSDELFGVRWGLEPTAAHAVLVLRIGFPAPVIVGDLDLERRSRACAASPQPLLPLGRRL